MMHDGRTFDTILDQGQGHGQGHLEVLKSAIFKIHFLFYLKRLNYIKWIIDTRQQTINISH